MTETSKRKPKEPAVAEATQAVQADEAERRLGRSIAIGLPVATVVAALAVGFIASVGPALLVITGGVLVGTIALLWASLRTLGGDAPLPQDMDHLAARADRVGDAEERKRAVLRALKDLEHERDIGKMDPEDYAEIAAHYRDQAKEILREIDAEVEPYRAKAEELAQKHLAKRGLAENLPLPHPNPPPDGEGAETALDEAHVSDNEEEQGSKEEAPGAVSRVACSKCATSNEGDAAFCKKCGNALRGVANAQA
ncbi:zinc ribbon domain-containing protein [Pendulispora rubella]|uniref:Zinc ribbon domain-containing protein n=1 Tax=Pendulispora rubella TaxID=2741070 RepID=A0ABZ2L3U9_9BACT